jgi:hypothetical protein
MTTAEPLNPRRVFRYEVPYGADVTHPLTGDPIAVGATPAGMEFWAEFAEEKPPVTRMFRVIGTGWPIPHGGRHVGTAPRTPDELVWHLFELPCPQPFEGGF